MYIYASAGEVHTYHTRTDFSLDNASVDPLAPASAVATAIAPSLSASSDSGIAMCAEARPGADAVSRTCDAEQPLSLAPSLVLLL